MEKDKVVEKNEFSKLPEPKSRRRREKSDAKDDRKKETEKKPRCEGPQVDAEPALPANFHLACDDIQRDREVITWYMTERVRSVSIHTQVQNAYVLYTLASFNLLLDLNFHIEAHELSQSCSVYLRADDTEQKMLADASFWNQWKFVLMLSVSNQNAQMAVSTLESRLAYQAAQIKRILQIADSAGRNL